MKLIIKDLTVSINNKIILKDFNLVINEGEIHVIMGPNGTGKSTLTKVIMGDINYKILKGEIYYNDILINDISVDERAKLGIFLCMQNPMEIEGVTNSDLIKNVLLDRGNFKLLNYIKEIESNVEKLNMDKEMIHRSVNVGFSGGEKKKNEILQMYMLKPSMILLDEIDSGLDVDSLKLIGNKVTEYFNIYKPGILLITHYNRLLEYIKPDFIHIMSNGKIVKTGGIELASDIETNGYKKFDFNSTCIMKEISKVE